MVREKGGEAIERESERGEGERERERERDVLLFIVNAESCLYEAHVFFVVFFFFFFFFFRPRTRTYLASRKLMGDNCVGEF